MSASGGPSGHKCLTAVRAIPSFLDALIGTKADVGSAPGSSSVDAAAFKSATVGLMAVAFRAHSIDLWSPCTGDGRVRPAGDRYFPAAQPAVGAGADLEAGRLAGADKQGG